MRKSSKMLIIKLALSLVSVMAQTKSLLFPKLLNGQHKKIRIAANSLVTPFSGYILSQHFLSKEIDRYRLYWLNPRSRRLRRFGKIKNESGDVIYCQVDQLKDFVDSFLPRISNPYVLITGKEQLPSLKKSDYVDAVLADDKLMAWFSQNQIYDNLPILPFPYGINLYSVVLVHARRDKIVADKNSNLLIPFVKVHSHLFSTPKGDREFIAKFMEQEKPLEEYLDDINRHKWVLSPAGDRPDTFRHWEILALGSNPVSKLPKSFGNLFGNSAVLLQSYDNIQAIKILDESCVPNRSLASLEFWRNLVIDTKNHYKS